MDMHIQATTQFLDIEYDFYGSDGDHKEQLL